MRTLLLLALVVLLAAPGCCVLAITPSWLADAPAPKTLDLRSESPAADLIAAR